MGLIRKEDVVVVLVHGYKDSSKGGIRTLKEALVNNGFSCVLPDLYPNDARNGLYELAEQLRLYIETEVPRNKKIVVVGLSMGALVARYFIQVLGGYKKTISFFSICGPHRGTLLAFFNGTAGVRQMRPFSHFIKTLKITSHRLENIPVVSYWKRFDRMIIPWSSCFLEQGQHVRVKSKLHRTVVRERELHVDLIARLEEAGASSEGLELAGGVPREAENGGNEGRF